MHADLHLVIDYREKTVIELLQRQCETPAFALGQRYDAVFGDLVIPFSVQSLPAGDFAICDGDVYILIVERKTKSDLLCSIVDGRFREQKERLGQTQASIVFILEALLEPGLKHVKGKDRVMTPSQTESMYFSAICNLQYKHNFKTFVVRNAQETLYLVSLLFKKVRNNDLDTLPKPAVVKAPKAKGEHALDNIFAHQLEVIPGISVTVAKKIAGMYPSAASLFQAYNEKAGDAERETMLADIEVTNGKKPRRIGPAASKKVYCALYKNS